jgi:hypothetical protein
MTSKKLTANAKTKRRFARTPSSDGNMQTPKAAKPGEGPIALKTDAIKVRSKSAPKASSKIASVIALLDRSQGAALAEIVAATGWQAHSVRAALAGLRKKGLQVGKSKIDGVTHYSISVA